MKNNITQEKQRLLLIDLCARLSYGVKGIHRGKVHDLFTIDCREVNNACIQVDGYDAWFSVDTFKPYLRPMSSMTEEEEKVFNDFLEFQAEYVSDTDLDNKTDMYDWLNTHHFDYRGLIEKSLALIAPEEMYKTE